MTEIGFAETRHRVLGLYGDGDYAAAMQIAQSAVIEFPDRIDQTTYWVACLYALLGRQEQALWTLEEGFARGLWWSPEQLEADPDLTVLRADGRFRALVTGSEQARASAIASLSTEPLIRGVEQPPARAVLVLLHGRGQMAEDVLERWTAANQTLIVAPRSTQPFGMRTVCWDDPQRAEADVQHAVELASSWSDVAGLPLLTAGFSQGAGLAIALAAKRCPPGVVGFIAVVPNVGLARDLIGADRRAVEGLRGHLIIGELDPRRDECETLAEQLRDDGAEVQLEVVEGLRHDYPLDFEDRLPQLLDWTLEGGG